MATKAAGTIEIASWDEQTLTEIDGNRKVTTTSVTQKLKGDIEGDGSATWLSAYFEDGTAEYVGYQRIVGRLGGAEGSMLLRVKGGYDGTVARSEWAVVEGTGTGSLRAVTGSGLSEATSDGSVGYSLDYHLE